MTEPRQPDAVAGQPSDPAPPPPEPGGRAVLRHRRGSRWMHWVNFPLLVIMLWSGFRIYWAEQEWAFGILDWEWFQFFPDWINEPLGFDRKLARGLAFHLSFAWLFVLNGLAYTAYTAWKGEWRKLVPSMRSLKRVPATVLHDLGLRHEAPANPGYYNAAQQTSYTGIIMLGAVATATGFALFKPTQLSVLVTMFGGYSSARLIHFTASIVFILFFVVHIVQVARSGRHTFMAMVSGYELLTDERDRESTVV